MTNNIWIILAILSVAVLIIYFQQGRNAVYGGLTIGVIIGLIITLFIGFNWSIIGKAAIIGTITGFVSELLPLLFSKAAKKKEIQKLNVNAQKGVISKDKSSSIDEIYLNNYPKANQQGILFVEDDAMLIYMFVYKFKKAGFKVAALPNAGGVFVEKVASMQPDLISLGIMMPGRSGFEALELLKTDKRTKDTPVVILSNYGQEEAIQKAMALGAVDYLIKANYTTQEIVDRYSIILKNTGAIHQ